MEKVENVLLFGDEFTPENNISYKQTKFKNDLQMIQYLKQFIIVEEEPITPYKYKAGHYNKKGHYINGKKVNRQIYKYVKKWLEEN